MCGIAGVFSSDQALAQAAVAAMTHQLQHRGPDDEGIETIHTAGGEVVVFGFRRLSIIDLSPAGHQPMYDPVTGNWLIFNGEIYNYRELRAELNGLGETDWRSQSDTEVILKAYRRFGDACVERLSGMFAFALWDAKRQRMLLVRDRLGIKPLYYTRLNQSTLIFASELRALLASGFVSPDPCLEAVDSYLELGAVQEPLTIVQGVQSVAPGSIITADANGQTERRYWEIGLPTYRENVTELGAVARVHELLQAAVKRHLISDVPVGVLLSGGLDSSALVALSRSAGQKHVRTISVVFDEPEYSEEAYSRLIAKIFQTEHTEVRLSPGRLLEEVEPALAAADQPTVDGINTFIVTKAARRVGLKVVLSGLGGDEIFAGYPTFRWGRRLKQFQQLNPLIRRPLAEAAGWIMARNDGWAKLAGWLSGPAEGYPYFVMRQLFGAADRRALTGLNTNGRHGVVDRIHNDNDSVNEITRFELSYYMRNMLLRDSDTMSMAHGVELRVPLLDDALVEYVMNLPGHFKLAHGQLKPLLAKAIAGELPPLIGSRAKLGFTLPFQSWLHGSLGKEVEDVLLDPGIGGRLKSHLSMSAIEQVWRRFRHGAGHWSRPWALYSLKKWADLYMV